MSSFLWSDAWILTAIAVASRETPAELWQILAAADALDHSLPLDEELHGALSRLTESKHIEDFFARFKLGTGVPPELKAKLSQATDYKEAEKFLSSEERKSSGVGDTRNQIRYRRLTGEQIREADKKYRRWLKQEAGQSGSQP